jgi:hypothetical protein
LGSAAHPIFYAKALARAVLFIVLGLSCAQFIDHVGKSDVPAHQALLAAEVESTYLMSSTSLPISL